MARMTTVFLSFSRLQSSSGESCAPKHSIPLYPRKACSICDRRTGSPSVQEHSPAILSSVESTPKSRNATRHENGPHASFVCRIGDTSGSCRRVLCGRHTMSENQHHERCCTTDTDHSFGFVTFVFRCLNHRRAMTAQKPSSTTPFMISK